MSNCPICLGNCKDAVCIPCGHTFCSDCLTDYLGNYSADGITAACPTCRTDFSTVIPSLVALPRQFHQFIYSPIRRVYLDNTPDDDEDVQERLDAALARIRDLEEGERVLLRECERHLATSRAHQEADKASRRKVKTLKRELADAHRTEEGLEQDLAELRDALAELQDDSEARQADLRDELDELQHQSNDSRNHLEDQLRLLEDERDELLTVEHTLRSDNDHLRRERNTSERNASDLQKNYDYIKQKYEALKRLQRDAGSANNNSLASSTRKRKAIKRSSSSEEEELERPHIKRRVVNVAVPQSSEERTADRRAELIALAGTAGSEYVAGSSTSASRPKIKREISNVSLPRPGPSTVQFKAFPRSTSNSAAINAQIKMFPFNTALFMEQGTRRLPSMKLRRDDSAEEDPFSEGSELSM